MPTVSSIAETAANLQDAANREHAYHKEPAAGPLPETLGPAQFRDDKAAYLAYAIAFKIRELLYQEPCYCPCDKNSKHTSLLDCYTETHAATCRLCQMEVFFIYERAKSGKSVSEIREAMARGEHWKVDVDDYVQQHYAEFAPSPK